ncbi:MAG: D-alanine--D-alanine ligase [Clostridia bacterium]|nr:D-alanine--D-alanine ligase [Clostridia bacterium]
MNITILAGGLSPERDVSLVSGGLIARALAERGHKVLMIDVYEGIDLGGRDARELFTDTPPADFGISDRVPDLDEVKKRCGGRAAKIGPGVIDACRAADAVFLALHGDMGEDGSLQATLDNYGIKKYTGSGYAGSLLAMDKDISKRMMRPAGIPTPDWLYFDTETDTYERILREVGLPCVVKPTACGSSVGVSIVGSESELDEAIKFAAGYERKIVVEKKIEGREFSVGILGENALPPIEIIPKSGFYDYKNKYQSGCTEEICPAELSPEQTARMQDYAVRAFRCLRLSGYARADFIMDTEGEFWCLEVNNLPGMTPLSLLPQEAAAAGIEYGELCETIVKMALEKAV